MASITSTSATDPTNDVKTRAKYQPISLPTTEQMMMEDVMSNCFVKTAISGLMGGVAGVAFGLFSASLENAHGVGD
jgi:import inner membrane translocase subunit TIM22